MDEFNFGICIEPLLDWFRQNARVLPWRKSPDAYRVWVSEIMLQQTRVEAVKPYYERFLRELPDVSALAACPEERLLKLWEGLGYYNRVRHMQEAARVIMRDYDGEVPQEYEQLLSLPGIGHYTAGAIASIAYGRPYPAVDGNVLRVLMRLTGDASDIAKQSVRSRVEDWLSGWMQMFAADSITGNNADGETENADRVRKRNFCVTACAVLDLSKTGKGYGNPGMFNQALMELGALVCLPNGEPHCAECPWQPYCVACREGRTDTLPVKTKATKRRIEKKTVFLVWDGDQVAIDKRADKGLLAGLYELPNCEGHLTQEEAVAYVRQMGYDPLQIQPLADAKHIFSHVEWHMIGYAVRLAGFRVEPNRAVAGQGADNEGRNDLISEERKNTVSDEFRDSMMDDHQNRILDWTFVDVQDVADRYAIPAAFARYISYLEISELQDKRNADAGASAKQI